MSDARGALGGETPLMRQYYELKEQADGALLFFRMGDFYELFGDDAVVASRALGLTLTSRDKGKENPLPMAGVPAHSVDGYIQKLLNAGYKVGIGEQVEDPEEAKKRGAKSIVKRELIRTFTPAVQFESSQRQEQYLGLAVPVDSKNTAPNAPWNLVLIEPSTGETRFSPTWEKTRLWEELASLPVPHLLVWAEGVTIDDWKAGAPTRLVETLTPHFCSLDQARRGLEVQYGLASLDAFLPDDRVTQGLGALVLYTLKLLKRDRLEHIQPPRPLVASRSMQLGSRAAAHLDLIPSSDGNPNLFQTIDRCGTALGSRQLRQWLLAPLADVAEIGTRQEAVREFATDTARADRLRKQLAEVYDLDRLLGRLSAGLMNPRDTWALGRSLQQTSALSETIDRLASKEAKRLSGVLAEHRTSLSDLANHILSHQREEPPFTSRDGDIFRKGASSELDRLLDLAENGSRWLVELEARERNATGITSLKVRYNRVFGYYIEITSSNLKNVPAHYQRKQTMVGAERFFTEELKKFEDEILTASARQKAMESQLFDELVEKIRALTTAIMAVARAVGELDSLLSLAALRDLNGWSFPTIDDSFDLSIRAGRHPLVDGTARGTFVPNDLNLDTSKNVLLITGPNMGGKSTIMRQVALIVLLGQMGAPVPAREARWGIVSSLHTRIGAQDAISRGQSTFMVEMIELSQILHRADRRSLLILDEIGRGTSTYDGMSVAWSTIEWIAREIGARTLFATHYHELTHLPADLPGVANAHMAVDSRDDGSLRFLYLLKDGPTNESFGIQVAALAGLPAPVVSRAWEVLERLEKQNNGNSRNTGSTAQLSLFMPAPKPDPHAQRALTWMGEFEKLTPNEMTPIQALTRLIQLQEQIKEQKT